MKKGPRAVNLSDLVTHKGSQGQYEIITGNLDYTIKNHVNKMQISCHKLKCHFEIES